MTRKTSPSQNPTFPFLPRPTYHRPVTRRSTEICSTSAAMLLDSSSWSVSLTVAGERGQPVSQQSVLRPLPLAVMAHTDTGTSHTHSADTTGASCAPQAVDMRILVAHVIRA